VVVIVRVAPAGTMPRVHGKALVQAPLLESKLSPTGVGSVTDTLVASLGPLFVTVIVKTAVWPGVTDAGPALVIARSAAAGFTVTAAVCASFPGLGSLVTEVTDAVLRIGFGAP
jgi:hypothetical protein